MSKILQTRPRKVPQFSLLAKPSGPLCNLDCKYCFYLEKEAYFQESDKNKYYMNEEIQEIYVEQYLSSQQGSEVTFAFQGGEPTLIGLPYFQRLVKLVEKYKLPHQKVSYSLQTNGTCLNSEWGEFLKENNVLVGISLDGPAELHDAYRVNKAGLPTHDKVMKALALLQNYSIEYNTLSVIHLLNSQQPL